MVAEELLKSVSGKVGPQSRAMEEGKRMAGLTGPGLPGANGKRTEDAGDFIRAPKLIASLPKSPARPLHPGQLLIAAS